MTCCNAGPDGGPRSGKSSVVDFRARIVKKKDEKKKEQKEGDVMIYLVGMNLLKVFPKLPQRTFPNFLKR